MTLDDYLRDKNIARYRRLLAGASNERERRIIRNLLAEETAKLIRKLQQEPTSSEDRIAS